jgi:hypothetical protein
LLSSLDSSFCGTILFSFTACIELAPWVTEGRSVEVKLFIIIIVFTTNILLARGPADPDFLADVASSLPQQITPGTVQFYNKTLRCELLRLDHPIVGMSPFMDPLDIACVGKHILVADNTGRVSAYMIPTRDGDGLLLDPLFGRNGSIITPPNETRIRQIVPSGPDGFIAVRHQELYRLTKGVAGPPLQLPKSIVLALSQTEPWGLLIQRNSGENKHMRIDSLRMKGTRFESIPWIQESDGSPDMDDYAMVMTSCAKIIDDRILIAGLSVKKYGERGITQLICLDKNKNKIFRIGTPDAKLSEPDRFSYIAGIENVSNSIAVLDSSFKRMVFIGKQGEILQSFKLSPLLGKPRGLSIAGMTVGPEGSIYLLSRVARNIPDVAEIVVFRISGF